MSALHRGSEPGVHDGELTPTAQKAIDRYLYKFAVGLVLSLGALSALIAWGFSGVIITQAQKELGDGRELLGQLREKASAAQEVIVEITRAKAVALAAQQEAENASAAARDAMRASDRAQAAALANRSLGAPTRRTCRDNQRECSCADNEWAIGGGADGPGDNGLVMRTSFPSADGRAWIVECSNQGRNDNVPCPIAYAVCIPEAVRIASSGE